MATFIIAAVRTWNPLVPSVFHVLLVLFPASMPSLPPFYFSTWTVSAVSTEVLFCDAPDCIEMRVSNFELSLRCGSQISHNSMQQDYSLHVRSHAVTVSMYGAENWGLLRMVKLLCAHLFILSSGTLFDIMFCIKLRLQKLASDIRYYLQSLGGTR
jgi:hypothetical protein